MEPIAILEGNREPILRLLAAVIAGAGLGVDRELREKPAGLRTHALVALGSALITVLSVELVQVGPKLDAGAVSRTIQGVITGIGFLGAGVILRNQSGESVHGLTTAASIWVVASLGVACGLGQLPLAFSTLGIALLVLNLGGPLERALHRALVKLKHKQGGEGGLPG